jgi:hypothetical protein
MSSMKENGMDFGSKPRFKNLSWKPANGFIFCDSYGFMRILMDSYFVISFLGAKKRLYKRLRRLVGRSVPILLGKLVTSRLLREEEEEEENWLRRYSFAPRD